MIVACSSAVLLLLATEFTPDAPATTRAFESGWGEPHNGLSILAAASSDTASVGGTVRFEIFPRFLPLEGDGRVRDIDPSDGSWTLDLTRVDDGGSFARRANSHGPYSDRPGAAFLLAATLPPWTETFHLLTGDGEQVPAGDYVARLVYENEGTCFRRVLDEDGCEESIPVPPETMWAGRIVTGEFALHVLPRDPEECVIGLPTRLAITTSPNRRWGRFAGHEPRSYLMRPGFGAMLELECRVFVDGSPIDARSLRESGVDPNRFRCLSNAGQSRMTARHGTLAFADISFPDCSDLPEEFLAEHAVEIEAHIVVFEAPSSLGRGFRPDRPGVRRLDEVRIVTSLAPCVPGQPDTSR